MPKPLIGPYRAMFWYLGTSRAVHPPILASHSHPDWVAIKRLSKQMLAAIIVLLTVVSATAQTNKVDLGLRVIDSSTLESLPYSTVYNISRGSGTVANQEGYFYLAGNEIGDSIQISSIGYKTTILTLQNEELPEQILLVPRASLLKRIVVTADDTYLYDAVSSLHARKCVGVRKSKVYLLLESSRNGKQLEVVEQYFNGTFDDYEIKELAFKKGRISNVRLGGRFFISTETSKTFLGHSVFDKHRAYPNGPLAGGRRFLKKNYVLKLMSSYIKETSKILVIKCTPVKPNSLYETTVWIDVTQNKLLKTQSEILHTAKHPFIPTLGIKIKRVDMKEIVTFKEVDGCNIPELHSFYYSIKYLGLEAGLLEINSRADLMAYDYGAQFYPPIYEFSNARHEDYRRITAVPQDSVFWKSHQEPSIDHYETIRKRVLSQQTTLQWYAQQHETTILQFPYIVWSKDRIRITSPKRSIVDKLDKMNVLISDRYNLDLQIYLDYTIINSKPAIRSFAVYDPIRSYYRINLELTDVIFINMCFDLLEIQRRSLMKSLGDGSGSNYANVKDLYLDHTRNFKDTLEKFQSEVNRGRVYERLEFWNAYILERLGVDNFKLYNYYQE